MNENTGENDVKGLRQLRSWGNHLWQKQLKGICSVGQVEGVLRHQWDGDIITHCRPNCGPVSPWTLFLSLSLRVECWTVEPLVQSVQHCTQSAHWDCDCAGCWRGTCVREEVGSLPLVKNTCQHVGVLVHTMWGGQGEREREQLWTTCWPENTVS